MVQGVGPDEPEAACAHRRRHGHHHRPRPPSNRHCGRGGGAADRLGFSASVSVIFRASASASATCGSRRGKEAYRAEEQVCVQESAGAVAGRQGRCGERAGEDKLGAALAHRAARTHPSGGRRCSLSAAEAERQGARSRLRGAQGSAAALRAAAAAGGARRREQGRRGCAEPH
eukprot:1688387-Rhodomonas_salina.1